jgi:hypothetical protein
MKKRKAISQDVPPKLSDAEVENLKDRYPSVNLAYEIAIDSYDALVKRVDSIDGRLQTLLALFATVTATVPVIGAARGLSFHSRWFYGAVCAMVLATLVTAAARLAGHVKLLDPNTLNADYWLKYSEWEFKSLIIQYAGQAFTANKRLVDRKWFYTILVTITFFAGAACLALWVSRF